MSALQRGSEGRWVGRLTRADLIVLAVPLALGALLCAIELNTRSLWIDEGATYAITSQHGAALWHAIAHDGGNMLLYYLLEHVVGSLLGHAAWVMRLLSLVAVAITGALVSALGLRLFGGRRQAVAAGVLSVVSLPLVYWGQNARGYALMVMFATASMLAFVLLVAPERGEGPTLGDKRTPTVHFSPRVVIAYVLTTVAALYVGYDAALLIPAQLALLVLFGGRVRVVLGSLAAIIVLCVPLLVLAAQRGSGQLFWVPPISGSVLGQTALTLFSAGLPPSFHYTVTTIATAIVTGLLLILALSAGVRQAGRSVDRSAQWQILLLVSWLLVPSVIALVAYAAAEPIELARCAILLLPAVSLALVWLLWQRWVPRALGIFVLCAVIALRLAQVVPSYGTSPENWKAAVAYVRSDAGTASCMALYPQDGRQVFDYYLQNGRAAAPGSLTPVLPDLPWGRIRPFVEDYGTLDAGQLAGVAQRCPRLYLVASHVGQSNGPAVSREHLQRYHLLQRRLSELYPHSATRSFGWAAPVDVTVYSGA